MKNIIENPYINPENKFLSRQYKVYENFVAIFNSKQKFLRDKLRPDHRHLFRNLFHIYRNQVNNSSTPINLFQLPPLKTNRVALKKLTGRSESSIYRYIQKMTKAGIFLQADLETKTWQPGKTCHGPRANFDLYFNPELILIYDLSDPEYLPSCRFMSPQRDLFDSDLRSICTPYSMVPEHLNNVLIPVHSQNSQKIGIPLTRNKLPEQNQNILTRTRGNEQKNAGPLQAPEHVKQHITEHPEQFSEAPVFDSGQKQVQPGRKVSDQLFRPFESLEEKISWYRRQMSEWFYFYMLSVLFEGRTIFEGEKDRTIEYIEQYYFYGCITPAQFNVRYVEYKWRLDAVKKLVKKRNFNTHYIWPFTYVDVQKKGNNPDTGSPYCSFANTKPWYVKNLKNNCRKKNKGFLYNAYYKYMNHPCLNSFSDAITYLHKYSPEEEHELYQMVYANANTNIN